MTTRRLSRGTLVSHGGSVLPPGWAGPLSLPYVGLGPSAPRGRLTHRGGQKKKVEVHGARNESRIHIPLIELLISRLQDSIRLQPKPPRYLVPNRLASYMHGGYELVATFPAHGQAAQVPPVDPLGVMQHLDHLPEREQRVPVPPRRDAPDRAQRVQRDEVERVPARLTLARGRAPARRHASLHVQGEERRDGALHHFAPAEGEHEVVVRELDGRRVLHEHRRRETRRRRRVWVCGVGHRFGRRRPRRRRRRGRGAVLTAGDLEDEARERLAAARGL